MKKNHIMSRIFVTAMIKKGYLDLWSMKENTKDARKKNEALLFHILKRSQNCEYGKKYGFENIRTVEDYRKSVPITEYIDYEEYIDRMIENNEENVITSEKVIGYAQSSGSVGKRKFVPITQPDVNMYTKHTVTRMLALADRYYRRHYGKGLNPERGMYTGPAYDDFLPNGMVCSNVADVAGRQLGFFYPYFVNVPFRRLFNVREIDFYYINTRLALENRETMFMFAVFFKAISDYLRYLEKNWKQLAEDIEFGKISSLAKASPETKEMLEKILEPDPARAQEIRTECTKGFDETIRKRIWPNMSVISGIGTTTFEPFSRICRRNTKGVLYDFSIYGASEGLFAACDEIESEKQLLLVESCYYEFIPTDDKNRILSLNELEVGKEYIILITNQAGLYRYKCGDIVKVVGYQNECPYVVFARRIGQLLNVTGEKTTEEHMTEVVNQVEKVSGTRIMDWIVYTDVEHQPNRYVLLMENADGIDMKQYQKLAHEVLQKANPRYDYFVTRGNLDQISLGSLKYGSNREYMEKLIAKGIPSTQVKPIRIIDNKEKEQFFLQRILPD